MLEPAFLSASGVQPVARTTEQQEALESFRLFIRPEQNQARSVLWQLQNIECKTEAWAVSLCKINSHDARLTGGMIASPSLRR